MMGRPIVLDGTLEEYRREADFVQAQASIARGWSR